MTYEFVIEERIKHVVLGDGATPNEAKEDAFARLMRGIKSGEAPPHAYKLVVIECKRHDNKTTNKTTT